MGRNRTACPWLWEWGWGAAHPWDPALDGSSQAPHSIHSSPPPQGLDLVKAEGVLIYMCLNTLELWHVQLGAAFTNLSS